MTQTKLDLKHQIRLQHYSAIYSCLYICFYFLASNDWMGASKFDVAIVKLRKPLQLSSDVRAVNIQFARPTNTKKTYWIVGFGPTASGSMCGKSNKGELKLNHLKITAKLSLPEGGGLAYSHFLSDCLREVMFYFVLSSQRNIRESWI
jgi:hypothetical protein